MLLQFASLRVHGCSFMVAGRREESGAFKTLDDIQVPEPLQVAGLLSLAWQPSYSLLTCYASLTGSHRCCCCAIAVSMSIMGASAGQRRHHGALMGAGFICGHTRECLQGGCFVDRVEATSSENIDRMKLRNIRLFSQPVVDRSAFRSRCCHMLELGA